MLLLLFFSFYILIVFYGCYNFPLPPHNNYYINHEGDATIIDDESSDDIGIVGVYDSD